MSKAAMRSIEYGPFRVEFVPNGDRIAHVIYVREPLGAGAPETQDSAERPWIELLRSVESAADVVWPESPPLQELHIEDRGGVPVALLVGRAGKSHWSASIAFERFGDDVSSPTTGCKLVVDIACRLTALPQMLGSTYRLGGDTRWTGRRRREETDVSRWQSIGLFSGESTGWQLDVGAPGSAQAIGTAVSFRIVPQLPEQPVPATIRWRFALSLDR
jgi:hypothetical protein